MVAVLVMALSSAAYADQAQSPPAGPPAQPPPVVQQPPNQQPPAAQQPPNQQPPWAGPGQPGMPANLPPGAYPVPYPIYVVLKPKADTGLLNAGMGLTIAGVTSVTVGSILTVLSLFSSSAPMLIAGGVLAGSGVIMNAIGIPLWVVATNKLRNPVVPGARPNPEQVSFAPLALPPALASDPRLPAQRPFGGSIVVAF